MNMYAGALLTPMDIQVIRDGFKRLAGQPEELAADFYARLFALDPALRPMFKTDLKSQGAKLIGALAHVVHGLDRMDTIIEDVRALARRHVGYGTVPAHYATVGQALIETLEAKLGASFDAQARAAWGNAYGVLSEAMIAAATDAGGAARTAA